MKKKFWALIISIIAFAAAAAIGCGEVPSDGNKDGNEEHVHEFTEEVAMDEYLASPATCAESAKYYYSCKCGEKSERTFYFGSPKGHEFAKEWSRDKYHHWHEVVCDVSHKNVFAHTPHYFEDGECVECGQKDERSAAYIYENGGYTVAGLGDYAVNGDYNVVIPETYDDGEHGEAPVKAVGVSAFENYPLTRLLLPSSLTEIRARAFYDCGEIRDGIVIPVGVTSIGEDAFGGVRCVSFTGPAFALGFFDRRSMCVVNITAGEVLPARTFKDCRDLRSVTLGDSVKEIGDEAFYLCTGLTEIDLGGVEKIGSYAFEGCDAMSAIDLRKVKEIGDYALSDCRLLSSIDISAAVSVGKSPFAGCNNISAVTLGNNLKSIGDSAFYALDKVTALNLPASLETIGTYAFADMSALTSVNLTGVAIIPQGAFQNCESLTAVTFGERLTEIGESAFSRCGKLGTPNFPASLIKIGNFAFSHCDGLSAVDFPASVTEIGDYAFSECAGITAAAFRGKIRSLGECAFAGTSIAKIEIECDDLTTGYRVFEGAPLKEVTIRGTVKTLMRIDDAFGSRVEIADIPLSIANWFPKGKLKKVTLRGSGAVPAGLFSFDDSPLASLTFDGVTEIGHGAFNGCPLTEIDFGDSLRIIQSYAFNGCTDLKNLIVPDSVETIDSYAFGGHFEKVYVPATVKTESDAFANCSADYATAPAAAFGGFSVKHATVNDGGEIKSGYFTRESSIETVSLPKTTVIAADAFRYCPNLVSVDMPAVKTIGDYAFSECGSLKTITLPESVESIGERAFYGSKALEDVTFATLDMTVGEYAFAGLENLKSVHAPDVLGWISFCFGKYTYSSYDLYAGGALVTDVVVPDGINEIGEYAFARCTSIKTVDAGRQVTIIAAHAFDGCTALTDVNIGISVMTIGDAAFAGCAVTEYAIPASVTSIGSGVFHLNERLAGFTVDKNNARYVDYDGDLYDGLSGELVRYAVAKTGTAFVSPSFMKSVAPGAFRHANNLVSITLGSSVASIGNWAFGNCDALNEVTILCTNVKINGDVFWTSHPETLSVPAGAIGIVQYGVKNLTVNGGETLEAKAFAFHKTLERVTISDGIKTIGDEAFRNCPQLMSVTLADSVTTIGASAFHYAVALTSFTVPGKVTSIGAGAFLGTALTELNFVDPAGWYSGETAVEEATLSDPALAAELLKSSANAAFTKSTVVGE